MTGHLLHNPPPPPTLTDTRVSTPTHLFKAHKCLLLYGETHPLCPHQGNPHPKNSRHDITPVLTTRTTWRTKTGTNQRPTCLQTRCKTLGRPTPTCKGRGHSQRGLGEQSEIRSPANALLGLSNLQRGNHGTTQSSLFSGGIPAWHAVAMPFYHACLPRLRSFTSAELRESRHQTTDACSHRSTAPHNTPPPIVRSLTAVHVSPSAYATTSVPNECEGPTPRLQRRALERDGYEVKRRPRTLILAWGR